MLFDDSVFRISLYQNLRDNEPEVIDATWSDLKGALTTYPAPHCAQRGHGGLLPVCAGKKCKAKDGPAWSPADVGWGRRANANVQSITLAVYDLDHISAENVERVSNTVESSGFAAILHSTHSDSPHDRCLRLVVPLSRPCPPEQWARVRRTIMDAFELDADPATGDLSRLYFLPSHRDGATPYARAFEGEPVDLDAVLEAAGEPTSPLSHSPTSPPNTPATDLEALRAGLARVRRAKASSRDPNKKEQAELLGRVLDGEPLGDPGGRHKPRLRVTGLLAYHLPAGTPWEVALELLRPCLTATPLVEGETFDGAIEKTRKMYDDQIENRRRYDIARQAEEATLRELVSKVNGASTPAEAAEVIGDDWESLLIIGKDDAPKACAFNVTLILTHDPSVKGSIVWNNVTKTMDLNGGPFAGKNQEILPDVVAGWMQRTYGCMADAFLVRRGLLQIAYENVYDPLAEYLGELAWDQTPRIDTFLETYFGAVVTDNLTYIRAVSRRWLISLVARALEPGCKADDMLILEGVQGAGKSTVLEALVTSRYFIDTGLSIGEKDSMQAVANKWLVELGELASLRKSEVERVKQFLSSKVDIFRPPYGATMQESPRRCLFVGTTNHETYLQDTTGNRRFLPVRVAKPDPAAVARDRDQILAEAVFAYRAGERWHLTGDEVPLAVTETAARTQEPPEASVDEAVRRWWYGETPTRRHKFITTLDVAEAALHLTVDRIDHKVRTAIGVAMRRLGFTRKQSADGGRFYEATAELLAAPVRTSPARAGHLALVEAVKKETDEAVKKETDKE